MQLVIFLSVRDLGLISNLIDTKLNSKIEKGKENEEISYTNG